MTEIKNGANTMVKFFYNERGQRIRKDSYSGGSLQNTTYYALDLSGNTMAVYSKPVSGGIAQTDLPMYGLSRLGVYSKLDGSSNYEITDHLGNVRAVIKKISGNPVMQAYADYYPFGLKHTGYGYSQVVNSDYKYKYNGKEVQDELGLNFYDYGARNYDAALGRWMNIDPLAEQYNSWSSYNYTLNNPVLFIDPDGRGVNSTHTDENGNVVVVYDDGDKGVYKHEGNREQAKKEVEKKLYF